MTEEQIKVIIEEALTKLSSEEKPLEIQRIGERTICFRLGLYLQDKFHGYYFDSEYNADLDSGLSKQYSDLKGRKLTTPDFIIHKRTPKKSENLCIIELKLKGSSAKSRQEDIKKVKILRKHYGYKFAITIVLPRTWDNFIKRTEIKFHE